ncbi:MAG: thiamine pyrophosphate-dependent dehydrogenase E1 component subunit alpha [Chloroflexota bacterium]|nr:thiamine pyrophosphate-dependent dehydrogenase E1 component subunit alpha [Chloroflexota bacterium]
MAVSTRGDTVAQESPGETSLGEDDLRHIYRLMALTRAIDEKAWALNRQGRISFVASCRGHEASQVASGYALRAGRDIVFTYYRDIGVALSLGMDPRDLFLSSFAKPTPVNGSSRHLPWHLCHPQLRLMPATSVVASQIPQAAGAALAAKLKKEDAATIVYFGDGATSEGDFHEAMNWAGVHRLPLVFFCENNGYAISTPVSRQMGVTNVAERARAYGFHGVVVDGSDPVAVHRATAAALQKARGGGGPTLIDAHVRRLRAHSSDDDNRRYMSAEQIDELQKHDPVTEFRQSLVRQGVLSQQAAEQIDGEVKAQAEGAAAAAEAAADPAPQDLMTELYAPPIPDIGSNGRGDPGQKLGR